MHNFAIYLREERSVSRQRGCLLLVLREVVVDLVLDHLVPRTTHHFRELRHLMQQPVGGRVFSIVVQKSQQIFVLLNRFF